MKASLSAVITIMLVLNLEHSYAEETDSTKQEINTAQDQETKTAPDSAIQENLLQSNITFSRDAIESDNVRLDTITVSGQNEPLATISTQKLLRVPGAGYDPLKAIGALPGVTYGSGMGAQPAVRGSAPEDNGYFIDFLPVGFIFHSDSSSIISDNVLDDFILEKSVFSPQYNNAIGAVISATSRSPYYDEGQVIIDASLLQLGFLIEQPISDNQSFYFTARQSLFQFYLENFIDSDELKFTTIPEYYDYQGKYEIRLNNTDSVSIQVIGAQDKAGLLFADDSDAILQDPGLAGGIDINSRFHTQGVLWDKLYQNGGSHKVGLSRMEQLFNLNIGSGNTVNAELFTYSLRTQFNFPISYEHEIQWGVEYAENHIHYSGEVAGPPCGLTQPDCPSTGLPQPLEGSGVLIIRNYDAHIGDNWAVTQDWQLKPSLLFSWDDYTQETFVEPRIHSRWEFTDDWWFNLAYGHHHRQSNSFAQFIEPFGNRHLKQTTADHYEMGIEQQIGNSLLWKLDLYYKTFANIPMPRPEGSEYEQLPRYVNDLKGDAWGVELFVNKNLTDNWYGWLSVAYSRTKRKDLLTGNPFPYIYDQPLIINAVSTWQVSDKWQLGFKWRLQSGQLITPLIDAIPDTNDPSYYTPIYGELYSERLPVYHKLDFRADRTFRFTNWEMDFYAEVLNLYARRNVLGYSYKGADYSEKEKRTDLPIMVSLGIKAKL